MNYQNNENDLDKQLACSSCGLTMGESRLLRDLKRGEITLARRAEPSVTEAWLYICKKPGESRTYASVDENDTHHWPLDQWKSVEKIPLVRAALASPAVSQSTSKEADDYKLIAHLIGIIFFAGDFKAETANERQLEALLIKTGHRYRSWAEIDALVSVTQQAVSQKDGAAVDAKGCKNCDGIGECSMCGNAATTASTRACGQCFGKGVIANIGETCDLCNGSGRESEEEAAASAESCACGTHTKKACDLAGVCGQSAATTASASEWDAALEAAEEALMKLPFASEEQLKAFSAARRAVSSLKGRAPAPGRDATGLLDDLRRSESGALIVDYHTEQAIRAALARAPLPAQGGALDLHDAIMRLPDNGGDYEGRERTVYKIGHRDARHAAAELSLAAPAQAGDARWSKEPPTEQADYWNWDGDEDHAPMIYHVLWSGTAKKCFVSIGQYGIEQAIWCDEFGGYWMKIEQPSVPGAMSASQDKKPESK